MILRKLELFKRKLVTIALGGAIAAGCWLSASAVHAQTAAATPPPLPAGVQDVLKLSQAGLSEDVILSQVKNANTSYNLNVDQLIYLSKSGVSQNVIKALVSGGGAATPAAPVAPAAPAAPTAVAPTAPPIAMAPPVAPPPGSAPIVAPPLDDTGMPTTVPTYDSFHNQLAPYGSWSELPGYGPVWRPAVAQFDPAWRPYGNEGHWVYTDSGWYWQSDYPWGVIPFHYGRWFRDGLGWGWTPGYDYAPAWVSWRHSDGFVGWAPLPPGAVFRAGIGLEFGGHVGLAADFDFGLGFDAFTFVPYDHFWDHNLHYWWVPRDRADFLWHHSVILNGYRFDHGRFIVDGLGRDRIVRFTHHDVIVERPFFHGGDRHFDDHRGYRDDHHDDRHDHDRFH